MKLLCFEIRFVGFKKSMEQLIIEKWLSVNTSNKIEAIKLHRELNGSSLKESKFYCDVLQAKYFPNFNYEINQSWNECLDKKYHKKFKKYI